jgi:tetratricopeptide (TPR) repeat protein
MRSHALGLYMTGLWQLAWVQDAAGNPTDAVRALKQLHKLSCSASCYSVAALAQANLSSVYSRMSQAKKAAAAAAAAMQLLEVVGELRDSSHQEQGQHSAVATLAAAAVASAQAAVASASGQLPEAERRLQEGISVLQEWADGASGPSQGLWLVAQHAQMLLQLAICRQQQQDEEGAVAVLAEASAMLEAAGQASCQRHVRCGRYVRCGTCAFASSQKQGCLQGSSMVRLLCRAGSTCSMEVQ